MSRLGRRRAALAMLILALTAAALALALAPSPGTPRAEPAERAAPRADCARFAAPSGRNRAPGTRKRPFRTAQRLARSLRPGQTGCLRRGRYTAAADAFYVLEFSRAGRRGAPITVRSAPGERARLVGIVMVGRRADHVRLKGVDVVGTGEQNTVKIYAAHTVIANSEVTNKLRGDSCMIVGSPSGGRARRTVIRDSFFHDCGSPASGNKDHALYVAASDRARIVGNVFANSAAYAIQLYPDAQGTRVARNRIDGGPDTVRGGIVISGTSRTASSDNVVERNVIAHTATHGVYGYWSERTGSGNVVRANCIWATGEASVSTSGDGFEVGGNVDANPGFRDRARDDYRIDGDSRCRSVVGR